MSRAQRCMSMGAALWGEIPLRLLLICPVAIGRCTCYRRGEGVRSWIGCKPLGCVAGAAQWNAPALYGGKDRIAATGRLQLRK